MKKILIIATLALSLNTITAATSVKNNITENNIFQDKQYKAISNDKIATPVSKEIAEKYEGYAITSAAVSDDKEYKVTLTKEGKSVIVYYKADGDFVKEQKV